MDKIYNKKEIEAKIKEIVDTVVSNIPYDDKKQDEFLRKFSMLVSMGYTAFADVRDGIHIMTEHKIVKDKLKIKGLIRQQFSIRWQKIKPITIWLI